jgi:hypothetical protein
VPCVRVLRAAGYSSRRVCFRRDGSARLTGGMSLGHAALAVGSTAVESGSSGRRMVSDQPHSRKQRREPAREKPARMLSIVRRTKS